LGDADNFIEDLVFHLPFQHAATHQPGIDGQGVLLFLGNDDGDEPVIAKAVFQADPNWVELTGRLPKIDLLKVDDAGLKRILSAAPRSK